MKKKMIALFLGGTLLVSLFGCGNETKNKAQNGTNDSMVESETKDAGEEVSKETAESIPSQESLTYELEGDNALEYCDNVFLLDEEGRIVKEIKADDVKCADFLTKEELDELEQAQFVGYYGHYFVFKKYPYDSMDEKETVYAIDYENQTFQVLFSSDEFSSDKFGIADGKFYIMCENNEEYRDTLEHCFVDTNNGLMEVENPMQQVFEVYTKDENVSILYNDAFTPDLKKYGYFLVETEDGYMMVDENLKETWLDSNIQNIDGYSGSYITYLIEEPGHSDDSIVLDSYIYDIKNEMIYHVDENSRLLINGDHLYAMVYEIAEEGYYSTVHLYEYDPQVGRTNEIYSYESLPGYSSYLSGESCMQYVKDSIYYTVEQNGAIEWYRLYPSDQGYVTEDLDFKYYEFHYAKAGEVISMAKRFACEECGIHFGAACVEAFQCNLDFDGVAKINEDQKKKMEQDYKEFCERPALFELDDHNNHEEYMDYCDSVIEIDDAYQLGTHYLAVNRNSQVYTQTGTRSIEGKNQTLYDLNTGEEVDFSQFCSKTNEETLLLLADKVVEVYEEPKDSWSEPEYLAESKEELHDMVLHLETYDYTFLVYEDRIEIVVREGMLSEVYDGSLIYEFSYDELGFSLE